MTKEIHAHKVLHLLDKQSMPKSEFKTLIENKFGSDATFHTCKLNGFDVDSLLTFFEENNKVAVVDGHWTVNRQELCNH
ncbi:YecH family protein [Vibrio sp.]|uniref:DUF2492 family protein n=1 Tax=Vibrio viridaestus TaxID=2487322 RepID=A0A3N9TDA9_9VIBR|nr:YecH family metal-binding protein [Vibrio viridaestus]MDC0611241.1 YecH family protein [Vibrio sp.]RQW61505.1 DUF2492 family protein [Vibrio viridaestus]